MAKTTEEIYRELMEQGQNHQTQANNYLNQYDNRAAFSYDANNDPVYQSLRDQYVHQGKRAMTDTMGQAAGLTGGYASTYGQSVGNQAYNEYLTQLSAQIPGLAANARAAYDAEGDRLLNRYNLELNAAGTAYNQARDALGDMRYEQEYADNQAYQQWQKDQAEKEAAWNQQYQQWQMDRANQGDAWDREYQQWQQQQAEQQAAWDREYQQWQMGRSNQGDAWDRAMMMIQFGRMPDAEALAAAGISAEDAQWLTEYYSQLIANQNSGGNGSGGGRYYYGGGNDTSGGPDDETGGNNADQITYRGAYETMMAAKRLGDYSKAFEMMDRASNSNLSQSEKRQLWYLFQQLFGLQETDDVPIPPKGSGTPKTNPKPGDRTNQTK